MRLAASIDNRPAAALLSYTAGRRDKHRAMAARLASLELREDLTYPELKLRSLKLTDREICDFL